MCITGIINNNKIVLGIADENVEMAESADGNQLAFVNCGRLYSYNSVNKSIANVYGFYEDGKEADLLARENGIYKRLHSTQFSRTEADL